MFMRWERATTLGDTVVVTLSPDGAAVLIQRIAGGREEFVVSLDDFEEEWIPWLAEPFDTAREELAGYLLTLRQVAEREDDQIP